MNVNLPAANLRYLAVCDYIYIKLVRVAWSDKLLIFRYRQIPPRIHRMVIANGSHRKFAWQISVPKLLTPNSSLLTPNS